MFFTFHFTKCGLLLYCYQTAVTSLLFNSRPHRTLYDEYNSHLRVLLCPFYHSFSLQNSVLYELYMIVERCTVRRVKVCIAHLYTVDRKINKCITVSMSIKEKLFLFVTIQMALMPLLYQELLVSQLNELNCRLHRIDIACANETLFCIINFAFLS